MMGATLKSKNSQTPQQWAFWWPLDTYPPFNNEDCADEEFYESFPLYDTQSINKIPHDNE